MRLKQTVGLAVIALSMPLAVLAHGSVEHVVGNAIVSLGQHPLSPLVGEDIKMAFTFSLKDSNTRLADMDVKLNVIETFEGDASKDTIIRTETLKTDVNGTAQFVAGPFDQEKYFDIELTFADPVTHEDLTTGFLLKPRAIPTTAPAQVPSRASMIAMIGLAALAGFFAGRSRQKKTTA